MNTSLVITLRLLHIVLGAIWVGIAVFNAFFLGPAMAEAGPDGAKVMAGIQRRKLMTFLPVIALVTLISGVWLFGLVSAGDPGGYGRSPTGQAIGLGGLLALIAYLIGVLVTRPAMLRVATVAQSMATVAEAERAALATELGRVRARAGSSAKAVAVLLIVAVAAMAVGRYL